MADIKSNAVKEKRNRANDREVKKLRKLTQKVFKLEETYSKMSKEELQAQTGILKDRLAKGETLDAILPDAFALVREASWRILQKKHYEVQVMGGIALHQGKIAEMGTGEGKTLTSTLPIYLNALAGDGVHVVTTNEYLAKRDADQMSKVFNFLGLEVGVALAGQSTSEKIKAYQADITYTTNNELGFDYLRDNRVYSTIFRTQRGQPFAIVDEVDSIFIDDARTPLILAGAGAPPSEDYKMAQNFIEILNDEDFLIDERENTISLTEEGLDKLEAFYNMPDKSSDEYYDKYLVINQYVLNALRANFMMSLDKEYIVKNGEICIVDASTGRVMDGRRFSNGLHQAIEAKEGVEIKPENNTMATVTFQNYFKKYKKIAGMTGTAMTEKLEFEKTYDLDVVKIPTNKPKARIDYEDIMYATQDAKLKAIIEDIKIRHEKGQPILVGVSSVEQAEIYDAALTAAGIAHQTLSAKHHERESEIIAQAGRKGAVTIATNMAGRGTDILLGGNPEFMAMGQMRKEGFSEEEISYAMAFNQSDDEKLNAARATFNEYTNKYKQEITAPEKQEVIGLGGLMIIGTERSASRRIDDQLIGRGGRQGDPGESQFYLSAEDELFEVFGSEHMHDFFEQIGVNDEKPIQHPKMDKWIWQAQQSINGRDYNARQTVNKFDNVLNQQREIIYKKRNQVLESENCSTIIEGMLRDVVDRAVRNAISEDEKYSEWNLVKLKDELEKRLFPKNSVVIRPSFVENCTVNDIVDKLMTPVNKMFAKRKQEATEAGLDYEEMSRNALLHALDVNWELHLETMEMLKQGIGFRSLANEDPFIAYYRQAFDAFNGMVNNIEDMSTLKALNQEVILVARRVKELQQKGNTAKVAKKQTTKTAAEETTAIAEVKAEEQEEFEDETERED